LNARRVVVTGLGAVTPLGLSVKQSWQGILDGRSGIAAITHFDASEYSVTFCGAVKDLDMSQFLSAKEVRKVDPFIQYAIVAASEAVADSGLDFSQEDSTRVGVAVGSGIGGLTTIENNHSLLTEHGRVK
jgi:3-oxoacyl-[acyl-carrier-protein] synthase II